MKLPLQFQVKCHSQSGIQKVWSIDSYGQQTLCAIPSEFGGPGGGLSPEDLFAQALTNCFIATFKVYAENSKLTFSDVQVDTNLTVNMNDNKKVTMHSCHFDIRLYQTPQPEKAELLIKKSFESGFILNSVKTELSYSLQICE
ncbi:MAG: OsmC family protein [Bdellovibrionaceae bacterium]|nr:OsmC family protein [Pseudobdellovibrionaceae bacterium]